MMKENDFKPQIQTTLTQNHPFAETPHVHDYDAKSKSNAASAPAELKKKSLLKRPPLLHFLSEALVRVERQTKLQL